MIGKVHNPSGHRFTRVTLGNGLQMGMTAGALCSLISNV